MPSPSTPLVMLHLGLGSFHRAHQALYMQRLLDAHDRLDLSFADLAADLQAAREGRAGSTIYGALVAILRERMRRRAGPVTLLNCDNLRHNGDRSRAGLLQFIEVAGDGELLAW